MKRLLSTYDCASTIGGFLNCLRAAAIAFACVLTPEAVAQVCCPNGCVQDGNHCVTTGPNPRSCTPVACAPGGSRGPSGGGSTSGGASYPVQPSSQCMPAGPTQANIDAATNKCMKALRSNAELFGCMLEDDAGKAEDQRTGMSCPRRQAALAAQCRTRCVNFAKGVTESCGGDDFPNQVWHAVFKDIGGDTVGSARVKDCGPPLLSKAERIGQGVRNAPLIHK